MAQDRGTSSQRMVTKIFFSAKIGVSVSEHASGITSQLFNQKSVMLNYLAYKECFKWFLFTSRVTRIPSQVSTMSSLIQLGHEKSLLFSHPLVSF